MTAVLKISSDNATKFPILHFLVSYFPIFISQMCVETTHYLM